MWTMSMLRRTAPTRYEVHVGDVKIAEVDFGRSEGRSCCYLHTADRLTEHPTMSEALTELHRRLNAPPPEGATVGRGRAGLRPGDAGSESC